MRTKQRKQKNTLISCFNIDLKTFKSSQIKSFYSEIMVILNMDKKLTRLIYKIKVQPIYKMNLSIQEVAVIKGKGLQKLI